MPGFYASIVLVFISGVKLFDYIINGGGGGDIIERGWEEPTGVYGSKKRGIKPSGWHANITKKFS